MPDSATDAFQLDARLGADTRAIGELGLSRLLLMNDSRFPWLILVPRRAQARELVDLSEADHAALSAEIRQVSQALRDLVPTDKLNVAALGNMVPQLHVHVIARTRGDAAWPGPVWGAGRAEPYDVAAAERLMAGLRARLGL
ncbi:HIT domain-containing protein [Chelatococcus daeguensis]|uniref:HIT domain-containing protein n=1 Tax=Chelatococcus daeguensis TaxID=444444 RepID=UPI0007ABF8FC|nr:HIT family protein [Chelatococcus daeguensis]KZE36214.1 histidine triad (HIT) protein [Chelatococcus daeguensis]MBM3084317.1 HIT domain-containing protein [Chelatococcus daeguensis]